MRHPRVSCARATLRCLYVTDDAQYLTTLNALRPTTMEQAVAAFPIKAYPRFPLVREAAIDKGTYTPRDGYEQAASTLAHFLREQTVTVPLTYIQKLSGTTCCHRTHILALPDSNYLQVRECDMNLLTASATYARRCVRWDCFIVLLGQIPKRQVVSHHGDRITDTLFLLRGTTDHGLLGYVVASRFTGTYSDVAPVPAQVTASAS